MRRLAPSTFSLAMTFSEGFRFLVLVAKKSYQLRRRLTEEEEYELQAEAVNERGLLAELIGSLAIYWARVEVALDYANAVLIQHSAVKEARLPVSLKRKIGFFRKSFVEIPALAPFQTRAFEIVAEINRLKEIRHDIVHGIARNRMPGGIRQFVRHRYRGKEFEAETKTYPLRAIMAAYREAGELALRLLELTQELIPVLFPDYAKNADR
jgi:hypothetical protein